MKIFRKQNGETIVEVLIAVAVVSLILAASYALANRSSQTIRSAQERTEALKVAESQLEGLKENLAELDSAWRDGIDRCIVWDSSTGKLKKEQAEENCAFGPEDAPGERRYRVFIDQDDDNPSTYVAKILWDKLGGGTGELNATYNLPESAFIASQNPTTPNLTGKINVVAKKIPITAPTPNVCNLSATANKDGASITVSGHGGSQSRSTNPNSETTFENLLSNSTYSISASPPAGYQVCPPSSTSVAAQTSPPTVEFKIYPNCTTSHSSYWVYGANRADLNGYWKFGSSTPDTAYTQSYYDSGGVLRSVAPSWLYFSGTNSYSNGYRYYHVYNAVWNTTVSHSCTP